MKDHLPVNVVVGNNTYTIPGIVGIVAVITHKEIVTFRDSDLLHVPILGQFCPFLRINSVRLVQGFAVDINDVVLDTDSFTGQPNQALNVMILAIAQKVGNIGIVFSYRVE